MKKIFTSEDMLKALGLQIGSRFKLNDKIFEIYLSPQNEIRCENVDNPNQHFYFKNIIDKEIEILPPVKYVGETKCNKKCTNCPLKGIDCSFQDKTLYTILESWFLKYQDEAIYKIFKARLDEDIKE